jgi:hypothetical protein
MTTATAADLRARRTEIVNQHIDAENRHDPDGVVASFDQPNYDIPRSGRPGRSTAPKQCGRLDRRVLRGAHRGGAAPPGR